jgi:hypothetical protein
MISTKLTLQSTEKHGNVVTSEQIVGLITRDLEQTSCTSDRRQTEEAIRANISAFRATTLATVDPPDLRKYGPSHLELVGDPDTEQQGDDLKRSGRNLHQDGCTKIPVESISTGNVIRDE